MYKRLELAQLSHFPVEGLELREVPRQLRLERLRRRRVLRVALGLDSPWAADGRSHQAPTSIGTWPKMYTVIAMMEHVPMEPMEVRGQAKIHRVDPEFGSTLTASNRDSQSNCWVNLKIMGQPCEFQVGAR
jgi:hypothetical protein